jgi:heme iron utilization protein
MSSPQEALKTLFDQSPVASLATLEEGAPAVSLVPFVVLSEPVRFYILVSELSPHTRMLRTDARCGWMISEAPKEADARSNHALTRFMTRARAQFLSRESARDVGVEAAYRARFPIAETLLGLSDFYFVALTPIEGSASMVQGFGRAYEVHGENLDVFTHRRT